MMLRATTFTTAAAASLLALAGGALAAPDHGIVVSVNRPHHTVTVQEGRRTHVLHVAGRLPRLTAGSRVVFQRSTHGATHLRVATAHHPPRQRSARTTSFRATVVRAGARGLVVRTESGRLLTLSASRIKHSHVAASRLRAAADTVPSGGSVFVNIMGLQPGVTILVSETTDAAGNLTITITLPPTGAPGSAQASGTIGDVGDDTFSLLDGDGNELRLHMAPDALAGLGLSSCQTANVTYHQDAGILVADTVVPTGTSTTGDCTPTADATGTITQVSPDALTISTQSGSMTFSADGDVVDGYQVGDLVDVTYTTAADGSMQAGDVEYVEQEASGVVNAVTATSLSITDSSSGQSETFGADPQEGLELDGASFDGVQPGDSVDVSYHTSAGLAVADSVDDAGTAGLDPVNSDSPGSDSSGDSTGGPGGDSAGGDSPGSDSSSVAGSQDG